MTSTPNHHTTHITHTNTSHYTHHTLHTSHTTHKHITLHTSHTTHTHITHAHTNIEIFDNLQQQDAHEFLNYLLNTIADLLAGTLLIQQSLPLFPISSVWLMYARVEWSKQGRNEASFPLPTPLSLSPTAQQKAEGQPPKPTWVHKVFQGTLTNETRCLCCETVRSKDEDFLDLSLDIEQNTSLTHCLK